MRAYATELMHPAVAFALPQNSTERKGNAAKASKARERGKKITVQVGTVSGFFLCGAGEPKIRVVFNGKIQAFRYAKKRRKAMANGDITTPKKNMVETKQIRLAELTGSSLSEREDLIEDTKWMVETYEPRVSVESVKLKTTDAANGQVALTVNITGRTD